MNMLSKRSIPYFIIVFIVSFSMLISCEKEPQGMGRNLIPDSIFAYIDSTELIYSVSIKGDSLVTNKSSRQLLGHRIDQMFGISVSELITEISLVEQDSFNFGTNPKKDSVIFTLSFSGYSGDPDSQIEVYLYEYTDIIEGDTNVYSNIDISGKFNPVTLGSGYINFKDSALTIRITDDNFIQRIFNADDTVFTANEKLASYVRGLYLHPLNPSSGGAILYTDFSENPGSLSFYYYNDEDDSLDYHFSIGKYSTRFSIYHHDYQGFPINDFFNNGNVNDSLVFIQSMGGASGILRLPELENWMDSMPVAINHAKLILTPADTLVTGLKEEDYPELLNLWLVHTDGGYRFVYDYLINADSYGGQYDSNTNSYIFNISYHIQSFLEGKIDNFDFIITPDNPSDEFRQVILNGANHKGKNKMQMEIIYAPL